jgi:hypothetical protein
MGISYPPLEILVRKQWNTTFGIRDECTLISPELKTQGFYAAFYK